MQVQIEEKFKECCQLFKKGDILKADELIKEVFTEALDDEQIKFAFNCFSFWANIIRQISAVKDPYEKGETLLASWETFLVFVQKQKYKPDESNFYYFKSGIFSIALQNYSELLDVQDFDQQAEINRKIGLCYKKLGEYETAKNFLTKSNTLKPGTSAVIAELADCFALCGKDRQAKVLFREAFFIDAQKINLSFLDSELIQCLIRKTEEKGYTGSALAEWIPVYGQIFGVFTVKRQLKPQEVFKLKQKIYAAENEIKDPSCNRNVLTPRLCNLYFWLVDYYAMNNENSAKISEILVQIKIIAPAIYELYAK